MAMLSLCWLLTIRPFGLPIVALIIAFELLPSQYEDYRFNLLPQKFAIPAMSVVIIIFAIVGTLLFNVSGAIIRTYADGVVIANDPTFDHMYNPVRPDSVIGFVIENFPHLLFISIKRIAVFYLPFYTRFDNFHIMINIATYLPMLITSLIGSIYLIRQRHPTAPLLLTPVVAITSIIAVTFLSYSFRFRAPLGPVFALLTAYTLTSIPPTRKKSQYIVGVIRQVFS
jgi:hypothetical protein